MKNLLFNLFTVIILSTFLYNCGSSHNVVHDGKVYEVKGSKFYHAGVEVTETLPEETKANVRATLNERLQQEAEIASQQKELAKQQKEQEKARKMVEQNQKELEAQQKTIAKAQKEKVDARKNMVKISNKLNKEERKYSRLLKNGKLSPVDIEKWQAKIEKLKMEKSEAEAYYKSL